MKRAGWKSCNGANSGPLPAFVGLIDAIHPIGRGYQPLLRSGVRAMRTFVLAAARRAA
jgi:hypothetical protein